MAGFRSAWTPLWAAHGPVLWFVVAAAFALMGAVAGVVPASALPIAAHCDDHDLKPPRCRKLAHPGSGSGPAIETGGTMPATANTVPLLRPGTFRLDLSSFYATYPLFGLGNTRGGPTASLLGTFTLGYGVNDRLTLFGGASESNIVHSDGVFRGEFIDPRIGFVYRVANPPRLWNTALDFVGDLTANAPLSSPTKSTGPYGNLGPIARGRLLATHDFGHGFTLQANGGFQAAVVTSWPFGNLPDRTAEVDAILGISGQYRLSQLSDRLYVNGELAVLKPLTNSNVQIYASPFRTADVYSATLGTTYVIKPGFMLARVTDTVALNVVNGNNLFPPMGPRHFVSNTVGLTISFVNLTPQNWLRSVVR